MTPHRFAFVTLRYGEQILGGAETAVRRLAEKLAARGDVVEVFTTCATEVFEWRNRLAVGTEVVNGVLVNRFPVAFVDRDRFMQAQFDLQQTRDKATERAWLEYGAHAPQLYEQLLRRRDDFELFFFAPYPFSLIHYAAAVTPSKSVIWPCLHDEYFAYLPATQVLLRYARGILYNSQPERLLAEDALGLVHPRAHTVGIMVDGITGDADRFRAASGLHDPFIAYSGRMEDAKNVPLLIEYFETYKRERPGNRLKLALAGDGPAARSTADIVHLGFLTQQPLADMYSAALALCQPSVNESFSIVIMEAWLAGAPILVHADCAVTRHYAATCGGGFAFGGYDDFAAALDLLQLHPQLRDKMGASGRRYVQNECSSTATLRRFDGALKDWLA
jgi:glycosyltransferase involved in cell wall biosynthesis